MQQMNTNNITFDQDNNIARIVESPRHRSSRRQSVDTRLKKQGKKDRNQSALLPELGMSENRRYPEDEIQKVKAEDRNMLNFVQASKKQMRDVIGLQQPQAKRFFDDSLINNDVKISTIETTNKATFSSRMRPSIQSVKQSNLKMEALSSLDQLNDEISEMAYSRRHSRAAFQHKNSLSSNVAHLISPRSGLMQVPSKASLATEGQQPFRSPRSVLVGRGPGSPTAQSSTVVNLKRELKHLSRYLDSREMQIRTALDGTQKLDERLKHNKSMEELYHQVMSQVRSKLPQSSMFLGEVVIRVMNGLQECFQLQHKSMQKKVDIRNKKIELLNNEIAEQKEIFYEFKRNKTIDAYFRKYGDDVIIKTGRKEKDYLKDLVKTVDDFLETGGSILQKTDVYGERQISKDSEPSGVNSLLIQLSQQSKNLEVPNQPDNPIAGIDQQREVVMNDFKKTLKYEANEVRGLIESHVKNQMGLTKPTADGECQTLTFWRLKDTIVDEFRTQIEQKTAERAEENAGIKHARLNKEIEALTEKNIGLREKVSSLQYKLGNLGKEAFLEDIRLQIQQFFASRLGKKSQHIMKEFNENILGITEAVVDYGNSSKASPLFGSKESMSPRSPKRKIAKLTNSREGSSFINLQKSHESLNSAGGKIRHTKKKMKDYDYGDEDSEPLSETEYSVSMAATSKLSKHPDSEFLKSHKSQAPSALKIQKAQKPGQVEEITVEVNVNMQNVVEELATPQRTETPTPIPKNDIIDESTSPKVKGKDESTPAPKVKDKDESPSVVKGKVVAAEESKTLSTPTMAKQQSATSAGNRKSGSQSKSPTRKNNQGSKAVSGGKKGVSSPVKVKKDATPTPTIKEEPENEGQANNQDMKDTQYQQKVEGLVDSSPSKTKDDSPQKKMNTTGGAQSTREDFNQSKKGGDDRKKLMEELKEVKVITSKLKENMGVTKLNKSDELLEVVISTIDRLQITAKITNKIIKLNTDESKVVELSKGFVERASKLCEKIIEVKTIQAKIKNGLEVHELVDSISKLLRRKSKTLPERDQIIVELNKLELAESKLEGKQLTKKDYEKISAIDKQSATLDQEITTQLLDIKFVKAQKGGAKSKKSIKQEAEALDLHVEIPEKNKVAEAIESLQKVKSQIAEDNSATLFQATQLAQKKGRSLQKQQLISSKVKRILKYMAETIKWLQESENDFEIIEADESEHDESKRSSSHRLQGTSSQSFNKPKKSTFTVRSEAHSPDYTGDQLPVPNKKTIIKVKTKVNSAQIAQQLNNDQQQTLGRMGDAIIKIKEKVTSAQIAQQKTNDQQQTLGRIGEVMEIDTQEGRASPQAYDSDNSQRNQSTLFNKNHGDRSSRVEVFSTRKTQSKFYRDGGGEEQPNGGESSSEGGNGHKNQAVKQTQQQQKADDDRLELTLQMGSDTPNIDHGNNRKQFAELFNMEKTMEQTAQRSGDANSFQIAEAASQFVENKTAQKSMQLQTKQQVSQSKPQNNTSNSGIAQPGGGAKDINLRQSAAETDYLKTASHFGAETVRADLKLINVGLVHNNQQAGETQEFLKGLQTNMAVDQKKSVLSKTKAKHEVYLHDKKEKANMGMQTTLRTTAQLNKDLEEQTTQQQNIIDASNLDLDDQLNSSRYPTNQQQQQNNKSPVAKSSPQNQLQNSPKMQMLQDLRNMQPSELKITKKPYHSHIKVVQEGDKEYHIMPETTIRQRQALGSVLMLTQETQTENRSLIKYLLTLINETIMTQLEEKSIRMTNDDFKESVNQFTQAIPNVYDRIKQKSDTFFIDEQLGPNFTTAQHLADTNFEMNPRNFSKLANSPNLQSNKDLFGMIDQVYDTARKDVVESPSQLTLQPVYASGAAGGVQVTRKQQKQNPQLSPIASIKALHESPSQKRLIQNTASVGSNLDTGNSPLAANQANVGTGMNKSPSRSQMVQFLSIGDFSRYGNHTLELSQEIKTRVNLRQVGAAGGGFMGHKVKNLPTNNHLE